MGEKEDTKELDCLVQNVLQRYMNDEINKDELKNKLLKLHKKHDNVTTRKRPEIKRQKLSHHKSDEVTECTVTRMNSADKGFKTLKDIALYIINNCKDDKDLEGFRIYYYKDDKKRKLRVLIDLSIEKFRNEVEQYEADRIEGIDFKDRYLSKQNFDKRKVKFIRRIESTIQRTSTIKLIDKINRVGGCFIPEPRDGVPEWTEDLVLTSNDSQNNNILDFPQDLSNGAAIVVAGESGSGKTWFAKYTIPNKLGKEKTAYIYHSLEDDDVKMLMYRLKPYPLLNNACQVGMKLLKEDSLQDSEVYKSIDRLSTAKESERNQKAKEFFFEMISQKLENRSKQAFNWWNTNNEYMNTIEKLVIIIDEVGKKPDFARALVDEVRSIYYDIIQGRLAKEVLLVLVGTGLEYQINANSLDYYVTTKEDEDLQNHYFTSFGTDPMKYNVIIMKGPNLQNNNKSICGEKMEDINNGIYSRVLATNTRMLTRGIIPVFKNEILTVNVEYPSLRRVALGSTNIIMDYAVRNYKRLNGLQRLSFCKAEMVVLIQFQLLVYIKLKLCDTDYPVFNQIRENFYSTFKDFQKDYELILNLGLITHDIKNTSNALCYLACDGQSAPVDAHDGIHFEIILQHHLVRLCQAIHNKQIYENFYTIFKATDEDLKLQDKKYFCGKYDLHQAWPPSSSKGDDKLSTYKKIKHELQARYEDYTDDDVNKIAELVKDKEKVGLVMRQTVSTAQGANVLVLSKEDDIILLDMYQAINYNKITTPETKMIKNAFSSLGVTVVDGIIQTEPEKGSAGFSYLGTKHFAKELGKKLSTTVQLRRRVLVFPTTWMSFSKTDAWENFSFMEAYEKNVIIWPREMLEPTISALDYTAPISQK